MVSGSLKTNKLLLQGDGVGDVTLDVNNNSFRMRMGGEDLMTVEGSMGSVVPGIDDTSPSGKYKYLPFILNFPSDNKSFSLITV